MQCGQEIAWASTGWRQRGQSGIDFACGGVMLSVSSEGGFSERGLVRSNSPSGDWMLQNRKICQCWCNFKFTNGFAALAVGLSRSGITEHTTGKSMDNNNLLKQLVMLGIGTTSLVAEKLQEASEQWVKDGKINPEQAKTFVDDMTEQLKSEQGNWETQLQRQLRNILQDMGVPRQSEMDELRGRLDRLERQMRDLENRNWR